MTLEKQGVFVVSDLHLGGRKEPDPFGFQKCSPTCQRRFCDFADWLCHHPDRAQRTFHLVLNGDLVDFLSEEPFVSFRAHDGAATEKLDRILDRHTAVWSALQRVVESGIQVSILLGDADLELSFPGPRRRMLDTLGSGRVEFIYDNQALSIGPILIEHGNRYDRVHTVPHNKLRHVRSNLSRRESPKILPNLLGRELVANVANELKRCGLTFVDMVKPEPVAALLLMATVDGEWLEKTQLRNLIRTMLRPGGNFVDPAFYTDPREKASDSMEHPAVLDFERSFSQAGVANPLKSWLTDTQTKARRDPLRREAVDHPEELLGRLLTLPIEEQKGSEPPQIGQDDGGADSAGAGRAKPPNSAHESGWEQKAFWKQWRTIRENRSAELTRCLLAGLRAFRQPYFSAWSSDREDPCYLRAADTAAKEGYRVVVYGHTHLPKQLSLPRRNALYLNTGSWTEKMNVPPAVWDRDVSVAQNALNDFLADLDAHRIEKHSVGGKTFARVDLDGDDLRRAGLWVFDQQGAHSVER
jgi:UDP-2,3-diacylglucosamine pyrophosphatase LpxH